MLILVHFERFLVLREISRKVDKNFSGLKATGWVFMRYSQYVEFQLKKSQSKQ